MWKLFAKQQQLLLLGQWILPRWRETESQGTLPVAKTRYSSVWIQNLLYRAIQVIWYSSSVTMLFTFHLWIMRNCIRTDLVFRYSNSRIWRVHRMHESQICSHTLLVVGISLLGRVAAVVFFFLCSMKMHWKALWNNVSRTPCSVARTLETFFHWFLAAYPATRHHRQSQKIQIPYNPSLALTLLVISSRC